MYLSSIEIYGFKSFANKTKLNFSDGMTAVVGPNGCGKSNIVDAVRWVLGEKRASALRSDVMENVIFNGTKNRKPLGMSEVTLTIENNKGILPVEYSQVTIARRLFRSGESEYLLNNSKCRLKDILDLFMDTGMGSDSYSVIELKMVEAILSGKLDERRSMFEEAAGVKKYKTRRKEARNKLASVKQDLDRVSDIVMEVTKNVNSLSRQAAKTRRYNKLQNELKSHETVLLMQKFNISNAEITEIKLKIAELEKEKIASEIRLSDDERLLRELNDKIMSYDDNLAKAAENERDISGKLSDTNREIALLTQKHQTLKGDVSRIESELKNSDSHQEAVKKNIARAEEKLEENKHSAKELNTKIETLTREASLAESKVSILRGETDEYSEQLNSKRSKLQSYSSEIRLNDGKINNLNNKLNLLNKEKLQIDELIKSFSKEKVSHEQNIQSLNSKLETSRLELDEKSSTKERLRREMDEISIEINKLKNELNNKNSEISFLRGISIADEASKYLIGNSNWNHGSEKALLGEKIDTDEKYRNAVMASLGEYAKAIITTDATEALAGIDILERDKKGKACFISQDLVANNEHNILNLSGEGIIGEIAELINAQENILDAVRIITRGSVIVSTKQIAIEIIKSGTATRAITLDGEVFESSGLVKGGSKTGKEGLWLGRQTRIEKLEKESERLSNQLDILNNNYYEVNKKHKDIDLDSLRLIVKSTDNKLTSEHDRLRNIDVKQNTALGKVENLEHQAASIHDELKELDLERKQAEISHRELSEAIATDEKKFASLKFKLSLLESDSSKLRGELRNAELLKVKTDTEITNLESDINRMTRQADNIIKKRDENSIILEQLLSEIQQLDIARNQLSQESVNINSQLTAAKESYELVFQSRDKVREEASQVSEALGEKRMQLETLKSKIHGFDLEKGEINSKLRIISNKLFENYGIDSGEEQFELIEDFDAESAEREVADLKEKLAAIGNINFLALEEYDKEKERLDFYDAQLADLRESETTLIDTIDEINIAAEKSFSETFSLIRTYFKDLFVKLFGEDAEADIKLTDEDILESDILITAKPPNKRPHSIEMLSGGEKTLTAIALLFAIYLVKPSPFCILDEVDAPLDDANIGKFVSMIRDFSKETQFMIVTHNKKTMEACDTLYGITMVEDGVSKLVSVKFDRKEESLKN